MSNYKVESFYRALLPKGLTGTAGTVTVRISDVPTLPTGLLTIDPNTSREEIVEYTSFDTNAKTITIEKRGISPTANALTTATVDYNVPSLIFEHDPLAVISWDINNIHINSIPDLSTPLTATWDLTFSGDVAFTGTIKVPVFATVLARDSAIPTPSNGMACYVTFTGLHYDYSGGDWIERVTGATPNASETVAGKVEIATQAQVTAGTATGETGAMLAVTPATLKSDSDGRISALYASDAQVKAWTSSTTLVSPLQFKGIVMGSDSILASSNAQVNATGSYVKAKEFVATVDGTYRVNFYLTATTSQDSFTTTTYGRIYKNWVAVGTERTAVCNVIVTPTVSLFSEDIAFVTGDLIQIYIKETHASASPTHYISSASVSASYFPTILIPTVNL